CAGVCPADLDPGGNRDLARLPADRQGNRRTSGSVGFRCSPDGSDGRTLNPAFRKANYRFHGTHSFCRAVSLRLSVFRTLRLWHKACCKALHESMSERPRVIVALPNAMERAQAADWLSSEALEPVLPATAREALDCVRGRPYDLLIADS